MTGKLICEGCGRYEDECICEGGVSKQDEFLQGIRANEKDYLIYHLKTGWEWDIEKVLAKAKQHYEQKIDKLQKKIQTTNVYYLREIQKNKEESEQKGLDRPELKKKIDIITVKVYEMAKGSMERNGYAETVVHKATLEWARGEILALIKEAKREERGRIYYLLADFVSEMIKAPEMHGDKQLDPRLFQDFVKWWQALKKEK